MASTLTGLINNLTWASYGPPQAPATRPTGVSTAALTSAPWSRSAAHFQQIQGSARFSLVDNLNVTVQFSRQQSFVKQWVFNALSTTNQGLLLRHEQGHYDISALIARDFFVDCMLVKGETFASAADGQARITRISSLSVQMIDRVQRFYDSECHPEQSRGNYHGTKQQEWNTIFHNAWTRPRDSGTTGPGPNGTRIPHKARLIRMIENAGKTIP